MSGAEPAALSRGRSGDGLSASKVSTGIGHSRDHSSTRIVASSVELEFAFGQVIESAPKDAVDDHDEERHDDNAEIDRRLVTFLGHLRNVSTQAIGNKLVGPPRGDLRDDARAPCSAGRGNA